MPVAQSDRALVSGTSDSGSTPDGHSYKREKSELQYR